MATVRAIRETGRLINANVLMDAGTLEAIDEAAAAHGLTRSAFIARRRWRRFGVAVDPAGAATTVEAVAET
jgi:hypothetical protein